MKRDRQGRTKTERLVDEARRERRNGLIIAALAGAAIAVFVVLLVQDLLALGVF